MRRISSFRALIFALFVAALFVLSLAGCTSGGDGVIVVTATPDFVTATPDPSPTPETINPCDYNPLLHSCRIGEAINPISDINAEFDSRSLPFRFPGELLPNFRVVERWYQQIDLSFEEWSGWNGSAWDTDFIPEIIVNETQVRGDDVGNAEFNVSSGRGRIGWEYSLPPVRFEPETGYLIKYSYLFEADAAGRTFSAGTDVVAEYCTIYGDDGVTYRFPDQTVSMAERSGDLEEAAFFVYVERRGGIGGEIHCGWRVTQGILRGPLVLLSFEIIPVEWNRDDAQIVIE